MTEGVHPRNRGFAVRNKLAKVKMQAALFVVRFYSFFFSPIIFGKDYTTTAF